MDVVTGGYATMYGCSRSNEWEGYARSAEQNLV